MAGPNKVSYRRRFAVPIMRWLPLVGLVFLLLGLLLAGALDYLSVQSLARHRQALQALTNSNPLWAAGAYMAIYALATAASLPGGVILTLAGGLLFGVWLGGLYTVIGATAGAVAVFLAARTALGDALRRRAGPRLGVLIQGFRRDAVGYLLFLRLVPIFPFWLVNLVPAVVGVGLLPYTLATVAGIVPGTLVYAGLGNGLGAVLEAGQVPDLHLILAPSVLLPLLGLSVLALLPVLYRHWRTARQQGERHG